MMRVQTSPLCSKEKETKIKISHLTDAAAVLLMGEIYCITCGQEYDEFYGVKTLPHAVIDKKCPHCNKWFSQSYYKVILNSAIPAIFPCIV